ncbi:hypothetical protein BDY24DRAFT_412195 [Mrakia frigida]|uniref:uncharacterized protein n=1 Tax=Mrakia frigida TaxID=29902 RepID=UPI003FCC1DBF
MSSSVFDPPHPSLRIQPVVVEPKPFREFKAHDTLSPTVLLNPSFENLNLGGESSTKGRRELVDLASEEVGGEDLEDWTNKEIEDVSVCCLSGGTGGNAICSTFSPMTTTFILPISDDGGSSSEILRCLGGPSIGDIRSRLIRLAPSPTSPSCPPALAAVTRLLSHRFPWDVDEKEAKDLWREVVEGTSELWDGIDGDKREVLHRFFVFFESELLQRAHKGFSFRNCSLGNVFLSSTQRFFLSLPAAIFLFSSITQTQGRSTVIPAILTNHTATIAAELANSQTILGQCNISHPVVAAPPPSAAEPEPPARPVTPSPPIRRRQHTPSFGYLRVEDGIESPSSSGQATPTNGGGSGSSQSSGGGKGGGGGAATKGGNLVFTRTRAAGGDSDEGEHEEEGGGLESRIQRIFYINYVGTEIYPLASPEYLNALESKEVLVYSCGSLWTSIVPCLALQGVGSAIAESNTLRAKVLLLNSENDRETKSYTALDYIDAIVRTLNRYDTPPPLLPQTQTQPHTFAPSAPHLTPSSFAPPPSPKFLPTDVITHLVYLVDGRVEVDVSAIEALGIKVVAVEREGASEQDRKGKKKKGARFDAENVRRGLGRVIKGLGRS